MFRSLWVQLGVALVVVWWLASSGCSARNTPLPLSADLAPLQKQLNRLGEEERALVEAYVARSQGQRVPKRWASPDEPFTATTFGEAIEAQRRYQETSQAQEREHAEYLAREEAAYAPLRKAISVDLVRAKVMPVSEVAVLRAEPHLDWDELPARAAQTQVRVLRGGREQEESVAQYRLRNTSGQMIRAMRGTVEVWREPREPYRVTPLLSCYLDQGEIEAYANKQVVCAGMIGIGETREFMKLRRNQYRVIWKPSLVELADGTRLEYQRPGRG